MRTGLICIVLGALVAPGCANMYKQRVNQQLWERELRLQEDCIYKLRWALEDTQARLDEANQRLATAGKENDVLRDRSGGPDLTIPPGIEGPSGGGSGRRSEAPSLPPAPGAPLVEPGREFTPGGSSPPGTPPSSNRSGGGTSIVPPELRGPKVSPAGLTQPAANPLRLSESLNPDIEVERIMLDPNQTGQLKSAGRAGKDRLSVVIQQRDADDNRVLAPGDVTIVVVDPALEGSESRIARWNFEAEEVAKYVRRGRESGTLQFELPWPTPPAHTDLRLFVRFTTYDGRRLEANLPIEVQTAGSDSSSQDWKRSAAKSTNPDSTAAAPESEPRKRSVYDSKNTDETPAEPDDKPREAKSDGPAWSPYR